MVGGEKKQPRIKKIILVFHQTPIHSFHPLAPSGTSCMVTHDGSLA